MLKPLNNARKKFAVLEINNLWKIDILEFDHGSNQSNRSSVFF